MADDKQKQEGTGSRTQIIVAVIGVIGVIGAAIIGSLGKRSPSDTPNTPTAASTSPTPATPSSESPTPATPSSESPTPATPLPEETTLKVYANSIKGTPFQNRENTHVKVKFKVAPGETWLAIPEDVSNIPENAKGYLSAKGAPDFESNTTPCIRFPLGALIVVGERGECKTSGEEGSFELAPGETVRFLMNDVVTPQSNLYSDNQGSINVQVSVSKN